MYSLHIITELFVIQNGDEKHVSWGKEGAVSFLPL